MHRIAAVAIIGLAAIDYFFLDAKYLNALKALALSLIHSLGP